jgi:hypothetical protein
LSAHQPTLSPVNRLPAISPTVVLPALDAAICWCPPSWPRNATWVETNPSTAAGTRAHHELPTNSSASQHAAKHASVVAMRNA